VILTGAQRRALALLGQYPKAFTPFDAPTGKHVRELVKLGAAVKVGTRTYAITPAGVAALVALVADRTPPERLAELLRAVANRCDLAGVELARGVPTEAVVLRGLVHDAMIDLVEAEILANMLRRAAE
jgi:hypothetical protein